MIDTVDQLHFIGDHTGDVAVGEAVESEIQTAASTLQVRPGGPLP